MFVLYYWGNTPCTIDKVSVSPQHGVGILILGVRGAGHGGVRLLGLLSGANELRAARGQQLGRPPRPAVRARVAGGHCHALGWFPLEPF